MKKKMKIIIIVGIIVFIAIAGCIAFIVISNYNLKQMEKMSFDDMLKYTTKDRSDAVVTVGILKDGNFSYTVYGQNGVVLPEKEYTYEIGSISKTFTASLFSKAIEQGKVNIDDTIDKYLDLPKGHIYPTLADLMTHTSGYKEFYMEKQMISNHLHGINDFYGVSKDMILNKIKDIQLEDKSYSFKYSNFGYAVLGMILEDIYQQDFTTLMNNFVQQELKLEHTRMYNGTGDLQNFWLWSEQDAYMPAGALFSNITDMIKYAKMQLDNQPSYFAYGHNTIKSIDKRNKMYEKMGINMDSIGMAWLKDEANNFIWHNGATSNFNSYIGFCQDNQTAVVILANLPPDYKIPATVMGPKLLRDMK